MTEKDLAKKRLTSFKEFWPFYLSQHSHPINRLFHFEGTFLAILCLLGAWVWRDFTWVIMALVFGYGFAWIGHFFIEKNRPATFQYPLWSLRGDYKMFAYFVTGQLNKELKKHSIR